MALAGEAESPAAPQAQDEAPILQIPGLVNLAKLDRSCEVLDAMRKLELAQARSVTLGIMIASARPGERPRNFKGIEGAATATHQLRKRGSGTPLSEQAESVLTEAGLPLGRKVIQPQTYRVKPEYATDARKVTIAGEALGASGLPDDFIERQAEVSFAIVTDETIEAIFANYAHDREALLKFLHLTTDVIVVPNWEGDDREAIDFARDRFLDDARKPADQRAIVQSKALDKLEKQRRLSKAA